MVTAGPPGASRDQAASITGCPVPTANLFNFAGCSLLVAHSAPYR